MSPCCTQSAGPGGLSTAWAEGYAWARRTRVMRAAADGGSTFTERLPLRRGSPPGDTHGFVIVRFAEGYLPDYSETFLEAICAAERGELLEAVGDLIGSVRPIVDSVKPEVLRRFESRARESLGHEFVSLSRFWRIDGRKDAPGLDELEEQVRRWPGAESVYQEAGRGVGRPGGQ